MKASTFLRLVMAGTTALSGHVAWAQSQDPNRALSVVAPWEISNLDPSKAGYVFTRLEIAETLMSVNNAGALTGGLASQWETSPDQLKWRFKLRPDAKFHDGTAVTAEAAVKSLERALSQPGVLRSANIKKISAAAGDVVIELDKPFAPLPAYLAHSSTLILAPASYGTDGSVKAVIGSGPYKISRLQIPQRLDTERFAQYDGKAPAIQKVSYLAASRGETRGMLAESGQADLVFTHDAVAIDRLKNKSSVQFHTHSMPRTVYLKVNAGLPKFADPRVRQALSLAIDREGIAKAILREPTAQATQLFPPSLGDWHVKGLKPLEHNLVRARELLKAAGWHLDANGILHKEGQPFKATMRTFSDRPELPRVATALQAQLRQVGIDGAVAIGNSSEIPSGHTDGTLELAVVARSYALVPDPVATLLQDFGPKGGDWGAMGWTSPQVTGALDSLVSGADEKARPLLRSSVATVLQNELPVIPIAWIQQTASSSARLANVSIDPFETSYRISQLAWK
jgi:peptide/nickel transport system substrate-binding protein